MITLRHSVLSLAACIALLSADAVARVDVKIDFDKNFDFRPVRTWTR